MRTIQSLIIVFISFYALPALADHIKIRDAYIPEGPPVSRVLAGFMKVQNTSGETVYIADIKSRDFGAIEMHLSKEVDGIARMFPQSSLVIEPDSTLELKPGSYHLMLFRPQRVLRDGDSCVLTFTLGNGHTFDYTFRVRKTDR